MGENYPNPPIIEAVCEFRLPPNSKWDMTIPGLVYQDLAKDYPIKEQRMVRELRITQPEEGAEQKINVGASERICFLTEDRTAFVQVGPNLLAVNCLKPYPTWNSYKPRIADAFSAFRKTANVKALQRIGLRYVNRIELPSSSIEIDDYFDFRPHIGNRLPQSTNSFRLSCDLPMENGKSVCRVQLVSAVPQTTDMCAFVLDLDYYTEPQSVSPDDALIWVDQAHDQIERVFEGCITERLRDTFRKVS